LSKSTDFELAKKSADFWHTAGTCCKFLTKICEKTQKNAFRAESCAHAFQQAFSPWLSLLNASQARKSLLERVHTFRAKKYAFAYFMRNRRFLRNL
jgi:hypothetical protein